MKTKTFLTAALTLLTCGLAQAGEVYFERSRDLPLVYVNVVFRGGATQDADNKSGSTDMMAKLLLRGTKTKTKQQINLTLDQLGANLGVETRAEFVALRGNVLSENVGPFLALIEEIIAQPSFPAAEFEKLKREQISQISDELSSDRSLVRLRFEQAFFKGHPYSRPNNGKLKDLQTLTLDDVRAQYKKLVNPARLIVLANGDTTEDVLKGFESRISKYQWPHVELSSLPEFTNVPPKLHVVIVDKPDRTQTQVMIGQRGVPFKSPDLDALNLANFAFGGGTFHSRLMVELRVKRGWTYGAGSSFKFGTQPHSWRMSFFPKNSDTPPAIKEALNLVTALKEKGITQQEFEFAKQSMINSAGFDYDTPAKRMENKLNEILFGLPEGYFQETANRLSKVTLEQVNQALKQFLDPQHLLVAVVATASQTKADLAKAIGMPESEIEVTDFRKE
jgi:zinc protease